MHPGSHGEWPIHLLIANNEQLDYWLSKFIIEVRQYDGQPYPPNTLYNICCGLLRHIREAKQEINIFRDSAFSGFRRTLDGQMKILRSTVHGVQAKQAEPQRRSIRSIRPKELKSIYLLKKTLSIILFFIHHFFCILEVW